MTTIGNSQISQSLLTAAQNSGAIEQPPAPPSGPAGIKSEHEGRLSTGGLSTAGGAGVLSFSSASLDGVDWDALAADVSTTDAMSIQMSDIMVLLVNTMSTMRKGQRDAWMADAQNALQMGLNSADKMRASAAAKLACDCVSNGAAIITATAQLVTAGASLAKQVAVGNQVQQMAALQLKNLEAANAPLPDAPKVELPKTVAMLDEPGLDQVEMTSAFPEGAKVVDNPLYVKPDDALEMAGEKPDLAQSELTQPKPDTAAMDAAEQPQATSGELGQQSSVEKKDAAPARTASDQAKVAAKRDEIERWATDKQKELMAPFNAKMQIAEKILEATGGAAKFGAAFGEWQSAQLQADAQAARTRGDFYNTTAQVELDFANELRDTMKSALDTMKSVEASRHQAMQGIYNI